MAQKSVKKPLHIVSNETYKNLKNVIQKCPQDIDFLKKCEEIFDLYASPKNYLDWNSYVKVCLVVGSTHHWRTSIVYKDLPGLIATSVFREAIAAKASARYVSKHIVESFIQTLIPELPPEITEVFPFVHLMLPSNTVYDADGDEVISIIVHSGTFDAANVSEKQRSLAKLVFSNETILPDSLSGAKGLQIVTFTYKGMGVYQKFVTAEAKSWHEGFIESTGKNSDTNDKTEQIIRIAVNSLLVHLYEPELVTTDSAPVTKGVGFSSKSKAPLSPTWIGKTFRKEREERYSKVENSGRGPLRAHWRRGHWHSVCVGPKKVERLVQWFKPVYVNP